MILPYDMPAHVIVAEIEDCQRAAEAALREEGEDRRRGIYTSTLTAWPWIKRAALCRLELERRARA